MIKTPLPRVRWVIPVVNPRRASLRYRCLYPMTELARRGRDSNIWKDGECVDASLTLIFDAWTLFPTAGSSAVSKALVNLAATARLKGACIVLDNCDNQFASVTQPADWSDGLQRLRELARIAHVIVTCSKALSDAMQSHIDSRAQYVVIDDPIEEHIIYPDDMFVKTLFSIGQKLAWLRLLKHRAKLATDQLAGRTPLVWFGSHGNQFSPGGMLDILPLCAILERLAESYPISLTIISNQRKKFNAEFRHWSIPTYYLEWNRITFLSALKMHKISIIPAVDNAFTRCKSSNRLTVSIHHGLLVVADAIPSYMAFADVARIGDWERNLRGLLSDKANRSVELARCQRIVRSRNSLVTIVNYWEDLIFPSVAKLHDLQLP